MGAGQRAAEEEAHDGGAMGAGVSTSPVTSVLGSPATPDQSEGTRTSSASTRVLYDQKCTGKTRRDDGPRRRHGRRLGCSVLQRSRALIDEWRALGGRVSHRDSIGMEHGVRGASEAWANNGGDGWRERERTGEGKSEKAAIKTTI